jgi:hypothetical protein
MPFFKVKNSYNNNTLRYSFSIEVIPCKDDTNQICAPQDKIDKIFKHLYFTMYTIQNRIDFDKAKELSRSERIGQNGVVVSHSIQIDDSFHS